MRTSAWILPIVAMALGALAVGWPLVAACEIILTQESSGVEIRHATELIGVSAAWGFVVALGAILLGWAPGRWLGAALGRRGFLPLAALLLLPICLPAYVIFYAWWQSWPADTWLFRWAVANDQVQNVRNATLMLGFLCWSWPIVAWCVAGSVAATPAERAELLRLDGAGPLRRWLDRCRTDARGLLLGGLIVFLATFNNTVCFDLAEIFSFGNELRAIEALGATRRDVLTASLPATLLTVALAAAIWALLGGRGQPLPTRTAPPRRSTLAFASVIWLLSVAVPLALLGRNIIAAPGGRGLGAQFQEFTMFYGRGLVNTLLVSVVSAAFVVMIAAGLAWMWQDRRAWVRWLAHAQAVCWVVAAAVPGTLYGVALIGAYNRPGLDQAIYLHPMILVMGYLGRFAFIGALLGRWIAMREPAALHDLREIDGALGLISLLRATWPRLLAAGGATFGVVLVLSLSEIPVTALVRPPGFDVIAPSILNDMHFQRPQTVMFAAAVFVGLAMIVAVGAVASWLFVRRLSLAARAVPRAALAATSLIAVLSMPGCGVDPDNAPPLRTQSMFGVAGRGLGQFYYPRAMAIDFEREYIFIVDRSSRIQRFDLDGEPQLAWQMPNVDMGFPTGLAVAPDGRLFVADTHNFRVLVFDAEGNELMRFGAFGTEPGQFVYTTGIAFGPEDRIYVAETGGNDRIQVFDAEGNHLFHFGSFGTAEDQFNRPQSLMFNRDRTELFIADACNHRIVVTDPEGNVLRIIGRPGRAMGEFSYPYDVHVFDDGSFLVTEFHNCRIQKFSARGEPVGLWGRVGFRAGELQFPWNARGNDRLTYVLDSGNNRVQIIRTP